jgi:hypothetical protein
MAMHSNCTFSANFLIVYEELHLGNYLLSNNFCFKANIDKNGNFSVTQLSTGNVVWSSDTIGYYSLIRIG